MITFSRFVDPTQHQYIVEVLRSVNITDALVTSGWHLDFNGYPHFNIQSSRYPMTSHVYMLDEGRVFITV